MTSTFEKWLEEMRKSAESRERNVQILKEAKHLSEEQLRSLDSTLKKVTAFTKKLKNIGSTSAAQFMPELDRLNLSKYLDEIAANICEAKIKTADLAALIAFCVRLASLYREFPAYLVQEFRKQMPTKKGDRVENASKLRVDLRFFSELLLNGLFDKEGLQLLGSVLSFLVQTDKQDHVNVSVLMPFCRFSLCAITGQLPLSIVAAAEAEGQQVPREQFISSIFTEEKRNAVARLLNDYWDSLFEHTNRTRLEMNKLQRAIKRQERTRGDASADDRQRFEQAKLLFERLRQSAVELGECLGRAVPEMAEEPSDDEQADPAQRRLGKELSEGRLAIWPDRDSQLFYECLLDMTAYTPTAAAQAADAAAQAADAAAQAAEEQHQQKEKEQAINESIDNVDLSCLEEQQPQQPGDAEPEAEEEEEDSASMALDEPTAAAQADEQEVLQRQQFSASPPPLGGGGGTFAELLDRLPHCINRDLIDGAAVEFMKQHARNKAHRKRLVQHFLQAPADRLDLVPFYARFVATVRPAYPDMGTQVLHELLTRFRAISQKDVEMPKKGEKQKIVPGGRIENKVHLCAFLSELCKFGVLPKAEALTCLRSLLVQMRSYKVDMLCVMLEQMGPFLYRSSDAHAKMAVIMQVLRNKSANVQDARQKILLENAYFAVIPPEEQPLGGAMHTRLPPMQEFIMQQLASEIRVSIFRRIDWDNEELREFTLKLLSSPWRVHFDGLARLASLVSALNDHHDWIGVHVLDSVLEFVRLSMELNSSRMQQQAQSMVAYLGQLFNYNVCNTATLFKVLYQLISLGIQPPVLPTSDPGQAVSPDQLVVRLQRIRLATLLVDTVCEFFCTPGKTKKRMDHFLCFFLRFYHETREAWSQHVEELDEFPEEVEQAVTDLLRTWRKGDQFATSLADAREQVAQVEQLYKAKVDEVLAGMQRYAAESKEADTEDAHRRLNRIAEEEDEQTLVDEEEEREFEEEDEGSYDEDEEEEEEGDRHHRHKTLEKQGQQESLDQQQQQQQDFDEADQQVRVHTQQQQVLPEDEDFMRDFDKLMSDSLQSAPLALHGPTSDLTVPPQARQKFERKLTFAVSEASSATTSSSAMAGGTPPFSPVGEQHQLHQQQRQHLFQQQQSMSIASPPTARAANAQPRMALMLRGASGKGGGGGGGTGPGKSQVLLKPVRIDQSENLAEQWRLAKEEQERDRREMKKVTLALNERITQEAEEQHRQEQVADMERKFVFSSSTTATTMPSGWGGAPATTTGNGDDDE